MMRIFEKIKRVLIYFLNCFNKRDKNVWVFGEWFGKKSGDNSTYLANYVVNRFAEKNIYWISEKSTDISLIDKRIIVLRKDSKESKNILRKAAVAVIGQGICDLDSHYYNYCSNALKVNLWHGVPWKKIGYDVARKTGVRKGYKKIFFAVRKVFNRSYLFESPSDEYKKILVSAFNLDVKNIINAGQPRNSVLFDSTKISECRDKIADRINSDRIMMDSETKLIAYMPTFRDSSDDIFNFERLKNKESLEKYLYDNNIVIIQKAHFVTNECYDNNGKIQACDRIITNNNLNSQELLAASDILITDYSSCFFDFLLLDRPIIHYIYDYNFFRNIDRGLYYGWEDVNCGEVVFKEENLLKAIKNAIIDPQRDRELRIKRRRKFLTYESPYSCEIIVDAILNKL